MIDFRTSTLALAAIVACSGVAHAQFAPTHPGLLGLANESANGNGFRRVDQGFDDVSLLGQSFILQPINLRRDTDFDRIYDVGDGSGRFVRRSGALNAVFSQSEYANQRGRVTATVPAGTIYYIGEPTVIDDRQAPGYSQSLGTARRLLGTPISNDVFATPATRFANVAQPVATAGPGTHPDPTLAPTRIMRRSGELPPARRRTDVMTHEPYRKGRLHEMTKQAVLELIASEPEPAPPELDPEALLEDLERALER